MGNVREKKIRPFTKYLGRTEKVEFDFLSAAERQFAPTARKRACLAQIRPYLQKYFSNLLTLPLGKRLFYF